MYSLQAKQLTSKQSAHYMIRLYTKIDLIDETNINVYYWDDLKTIPKYKLEPVGKRVKYPKLVHYTRLGAYTLLLDVDMDVASLSIAAFTASVHLLYTFVCTYLYVYMYLSLFLSRTLYR
jgi:hypothetical protein